MGETYNYMCLLSFGSRRWRRMAMIEWTAGWRGRFVDRWHGGLVEM